MTTYYTRRAEASILMVVTGECEKCGATVTYEEKVKALASATSTSQATLAAPGDLNQRALKNLEAERQRRLAERDLGHSPCPRCGYLQSWMLEAARRSRATELARTVAVAVVALWIPLQLVLAVARHGLSAQTVVGTIFGNLCAAAVVGLLVGVAGAFGFRHLPFDPNQKLGPASRVTVPQVTFRKPDR